MQTAESIFKDILRARGITNLESFANPKYEDLGDPMLLPDIDKAISRIEKAHKKNEKIAVYGDYDVDGMTATTLLLDAFQQMGLNAVSFIPDRFVDGYGLSKRGVDELAKQDVSLFVTVDTGSLSHDHIAYAKVKHGIDVIVTDHHTVGDTLPDAVAVINPKRHDSEYPFRELAGVGVAFTFIRALQKTDIGIKVGQEKWLLDLVALGTVCDIVPLVGENRILVYWGLQVMAKTRRPGLLALMHVSDIDLDKITTTDIGYRLGPRLNAAGRLTHAKTSLGVLQAGSSDSATRGAAELDELNTKRRSQQDKIYKQARVMAEDATDESVHIFVHPEWSHGIVGVVASKLVEELGKPLFVMQQEGDTAKGSGRSFGDFHLADAINAHRELLESGGGHAMAAGMTVKMDNLDTLRAGLNEYYAKLNLQHQRTFLEPQADVVLDKMAGLDMDLISLLDKLSPYGNSHESPLFKIRDVTLKTWRGVGGEKKHAKLALRDSDGNELDGIGFSLSRDMPPNGSIVSVTTSLEPNTFRGITKPQLVVKKIKSAEL